MFLRDRNFNVEVFSHPTLKKLVKGFQRLSDHIPKQAPALSAKTIKQVVDVLRQLSVEGQVAAAALLFGTCSFLRQSNFLMTQGMLVNPHIVCRSDLVIKRNVMWIKVMSTKTLSRKKAVAIPIPKIHNSQYCPVQATIDAMNVVNGPSQGPVFLSPYSKSPMMAGRVTQLLRLALHLIGHPAATTATVHSTRRSGAQLGAHGGASQQEVESHGTWASRASEVYAPKKLYTSIPSIMSKSFK